MSAGGRPQPEFIVSCDGRAVELRVQGETVFTFLSREALESFLERGREAGEIKVRGGQAALRSMPGDPDDVDRQNPA